MFQTRKHRLESEYYKSQAVSFTICLSTQEDANKEHIFRPINEILVNTLKEDNCLLHIWVLMPNHCHMIVESRDETLDVLKTIDKFKQYSGFWFYNNKIKMKWKKSYYDHILRDEKDVENQVYYILNNPVRKGIVETWKEYPYKFSMIYDLDEL
jgi:REP element-mobilizing transposase RayT